jgi:hypothetical protein
LNVLKALSYLIVFVITYIFLSAFHQF